MKNKLQIGFIVGFGLLTAASQHLYSAEHTIRRVLLISIDGMHALDFATALRVSTAQTGDSPIVPISSNSLSRA